MHRVHQRYRAKVRQAGEDDCWLWTAARNEKGYGRFWDGERLDYAHRFGFRTLVGPLDEDWVLHRCDNPPCQNPAHWFRGTPADNVRDMIDKDRARWSRASRNRGESNPNVVLTDAQVAEIRARFTGARGEQTRLAREYGVSQPLISLIVRGRMRDGTTGTTSLLRV